MKLLVLLIALAVPTAAGYMAVAFFTRRDPEAGIIERLALGFGAGAGFLTYVMFLTGLAGIPFGALPLSIVMVVAAVVFYLLARRADGRPFATARFEFIDNLEGWRLFVVATLAAWLAWKAGFVFYDCMTRPVFSWDAWNHWSTGAKVFYYDRGLMLGDPAGEFFFGRGYRFIGHPVLNPLLQAWTALWLGEFHEVFSKGWAAFYLFALLAVFYTALRRECGRLASLGATVMLAGVPLITYHGTVAYADLPLAFYGFASVAGLWGFVSRGRAGDLVLAGLFASLAASTKNEGLFFFIAVGLSLLAYVLIEKKPVFKSLSLFLAPCALLMGPWYIFKTSLGLGFGHGEESKLTWLSDPKFGKETKREVHWEVVPIIFKNFFFKANFSLIFPFSVAVAALRLKEALTSRVRYLYIVSASIIAMFVAVYLLLEVTAVTESTGLERNTMTYLPVLLFTTVVLACRARAASGKTRR